MLPPQRRRLAHVPPKVSALAEFLIAELTDALNGTLNVGDRGKSARNRLRPLMIKQ
jgi:hypothetical protein